MTTKLNRTQYKVLVESKEQAEQFKQVLLALGEEVSPYYYLDYVADSDQPELMYMDGGWRCDEEACGREVVTIKDLAKLIVNEVKPILTSVDGVDLYEGDTPCWVMFNNDKWSMALESNIISVDNVIMAPSYKIFSNSQIAQAWIAEQNKPKEVIIERSGVKFATITKDKIVIENKTWMLDRNDLNEINAAVKSLDVL